MLLEQVHDAERERVVRADDGEVNFRFLREREQCGQIFRADGDAFDTFRRTGSLPVRCFGLGQAGSLPYFLLRDAGVALPCDVTVMGIRAEESCWFGVSYIGSRAALGTLPDGALAIVQGDFAAFARGHGLPVFGVSNKD